MRFNVINGKCLDVLPSLKNVDNPIIVTDPPFNIGYKYDSYADAMNRDDYFSMLKEVFESIGCPFVVVHYPESICELSISLGRAPERIASWVYNSNTARQHRDIAYWGVTPDFRLMTQPYKNPNDKRIKKLMESGKRGGAIV